MFLLTKGLFQEANPDDTNESKSSRKSYEQKCIQHDSRTNPSTPLTRQQALEQILKAFYDHESLCFTPQEEVSTRNNRTLSNL